jgi:hypothetical protein
MGQNGIYDVYRLACGHLQSEDHAPKRRVYQRIFCETCEKDQEIRSIND